MRWRHFFGGWTALFFVAYAVAVIALISRHEVWRDEVRALSLARSAANPYDLVQTQLVNEGHPALWHLLLWTGMCISDNAVVLKVVSIMVALIFSGLFFFRSPFPLPHRILFLCGHLPLYLYAVVARNYGISVVFLFLIAMEYSRPRRASPWIVGVCNALLANTNIYGAFCAIAYLLLPWRSSDGSGRICWRSWAIVVALTGLGGLLLAYTVWPAADDPVLANRYSAASGSAKSNMGERLGQALLATCSDDRAWIAFMATGRDVYDLVGPTWAHLVGLAGLLAIALLFLRARALLGAFLCALVLSGVFSRLVYPAEDRQMGVLAMFLLSFLWIHRSQADVGKHQMYWRCVLAALMLALVMQAVLGGLVVDKYLHVPFSQSKNAGDFLSRCDRRTIVVCEPDGYGDSLPYYAANDIYIVREERFGSHQTWSRSFCLTLTLRELVAAAEKLERDTGRPVLVSLPAPVEDLKEGLHGPAGRDLKITAADVPWFQERMMEVAASTGAGMEKYVFYALRSRAEGK